jgi:anthranilate phosphoribosyltransferase
VLDGEPGARRDIVVVNAAAALLLAQTAPDVKSALAKAAESIDTGSARAKLEQLTELTSELKA